MSNLRELTQQVAALNRALRNYMDQLESFRQSNAAQIELIQTQLAGDLSIPHAQRMVSCVADADASLKSSLDSLTRASSALTRVEMR